MLSIIGYKIDQLLQIYECIIHRIQMFVLSASRNIFALDDWHYKILVNVHTMDGVQIYSYLMVLLLLNNQHLN